MSLLTGPILAKPHAFDPDAYLREKDATFDPDAYLRETRVNEMASHVGPGESFGRGAAQGATLGLGDEAQGLVQAVGQKVLPESMGGIDYGKPFGQLYKEGRDTMRLENDAAKRAHGKTYFAGELAGGLAPTVALSPAARILPRSTAIAQGMAQGAGYSDASTAGGIASDSALGGAFGLVGHEVGSAVSKAGASLAGVARGRASQAAGRAATQAAEDETAKVASLGSKYGGLRQTENNAIISSLELEARGQLDPANLAKLNALKASGRVQEAMNESVKNNLDFLDTRIPEVAAAKSEWQAAKQALPKSIAARAAELSKPQILKDALSLAKSYGEPLVAAALAPTGLKPAAGMIFGRTRMGKAIGNRLARPGNQMAAFGALEGIANAPNTQVGTFLRRALAASSAPAAMELAQ